MKRSINARACNSGARNRGEQGSTKGVTQRITKARLQRFNDETGTIFTYYFFGKDGALRD
jgi:hypothetical protein